MRSDEACLFTFGVVRGISRWLVVVWLVVLGGGQGRAAELSSDSFSVAEAIASSEIRVELVPRRQITLSSEMAARVLKIAPREGRQFKKEEILVTLDCAMEVAQMQRARATLDAAEAKSRVNERLSHLQATSKLEEQVGQAEVAKAQAELAIIQVKINQCKIAAPFSGRVHTLLVQEHQYVKIGDPLMEILDEQNLEVVFLLPSRQLQYLTLGADFQVRIDETQRSYPAKITAFGAMIDAVSQSVKVYGAVDGHFPDLVPGMSGVVLLATKAIGSATSPIPP